MQFDMFYRIQSIEDIFVKYIADDPVRPNISYSNRIGQFKDVFLLEELGKIKAMACVSYQDNIPKLENELFMSSEPKVAVFYSIWSYEKGYGQKLILQSLNYIRQNFKEITMVLTLSPKTEMARKFHLNNGAIVFRDNDETVNYQYL